MGGAGQGVAVPDDGEDRDGCPPRASKSGRDGDAATGCACGRAFGSTADAAHSSPTSRSWTATPVITQPEASAVAMVTLWVATIH